MQGIIFKLISLVEEKLKVPCLYNDWNRLNKDTDKLSKSISDKDPKFPAVYIVIPAQGSVDSRFGRYRQSSILTINFLIETLERADFDGIENESRIEQMKYLAIRFLYHFEKSRLFEPLGDIIDFRNLYMITDNSLTGVSITIPVKELEGICFDDVEKEEEEEEIESEIEGDEPEQDTDIGDYFIYTKEDALGADHGYFDHNGIYINDPIYDTYHFIVSYEKGRMVKYSGLLEVPARMSFGSIVKIDADIFNPIRILRYTVSEDIQNTIFTVTSRIDVPFNVKVGTIEEDLSLYTPIAFT